jgi:hypothetical protein
MHLQAVLFEADDLNRVYSNLKKAEFGKPRL